ncbi:Gfo/Idh/MocA family oxidoreductase [Microbacterium sp. NPDC028030]|uniref:Gfo/Idh/MocA family protein n=1 Tax=Microbacterium sp. NPDC028030 TaxID=3155124 RepID=UPI00340E01CC
MHPTRRVALSGLGSIARQHAQALRRTAGTRIVAFDPSPEMREEALSRGLVDEVTTSFDALVDGDLDALIIAGPDHVHISQLSAASLRGIPTLVEKPVAESSTALTDALPSLRASAAPVLVGYVLRHRRVVETARRMILDGEIGHPVSFQVMLGAYGTIPAAASRFATASADRLYRDYSHEWDYLRWIFGPVGEVVATARTVDHVPHVESPNLVDALLRHQSGIVGAVHLDYVDQRGTRTLHVVGSGGTLFADIARGTISVRRAGENLERHHDFAESPAEPLARQAAHLLELAGDRGVTPRVGLDDGLAALSTAEALVRSAADDRWTAVDASAP